MKKIILSLALLIAPITAANAYLSISPSSMEFGSVKIGTQDRQMFFINNIGNENVQIFSCSVFGAFECDLNCFGMLFPGQSCSGSITFQPRDEHYEFESVYINTNSFPVNMSVHGYGVL